MCSAAFGWNVLYVIYIYSWWWTGKPGMLQFMGLQRVRHDRVTELIYTSIWSHMSLKANFPVRFLSVWSIHWWVGVLKSPTIIVFLLISFLLIICIYVLLSNFPDLGEVALCGSCPIGPRSIFTWSQKLYTLGVLEDPSLVVGLCTVGALAAESGHKTGWLPGLILQGGCLPYWWAGMSPSVACQTVWWILGLMLIHW